jgi:hypothetical protein
VFVGSSFAVIVVLRIDYITICQLRYAKPKGRAFWARAWGLKD